MRRAVLLVLLAGLVACSGGDGLTRAQFIRKGDAICQRFATGGSVLDVGGSDDVDAALVRVIRLAREARSDFAALDPPADGERAKRAILAFIDRSITQATRARAAVAKGDVATARQALVATAIPALTAQKAAEDYGFQECAGPSLPR
ncbi:MAG: hypothetical protein JWN67_113 [Actinomycetia bacterium]|nr:hypothetical protein [Actinomycetes bacterium]